ncbi:MAG: hypothetical protein IJ602_00385 [Paludibacteraceae bacterium]|nr:hypothetical protein [Paludibacteraceae bacterium]
MKKLMIIIAAMVLGTGAVAYAGNPGFGQRRYTVTGLVEYSYNKAWGHHANFDVQGLMPFNPHFEMEARVQFSTANVHSGAVQLRPKFEVPVGEMFLETDVYYRGVARNRMSDLSAALGVGYRMDYVSVTLGVYCRVLNDWDRSIYTDESYVVEPFNMLYRLEVFCRPQNNPWNLSFLISDIDDYQLERMWQPLFGIGAYYDVTGHWRLNFAAQCKPTGMFHLNANFYGATFRTGFSYRF